MLLLIVIRNVPNFWSTSFEMHWTLRLFQDGEGVVHPDRGAKPLYEAAAGCCLDVRPLCKTYLLLKTRREYLYHTGGFQFNYYHYSSDDNKNELTKV